MPVLLFVDDEPNILSSLRRLFRPHSYKILIANSGQEGLDIMEKETVDLVISDMRMPVMDGAVFLTNVKARWPNTIRLLLTGYADIQSTIDAINRGEIYRYITKPWNDNDIVLVVKQALERKYLENEKKRLEELTFRQNEELKSLNANLEAKVEERTADLKKAHASLLVANDKLKSNFLTSIKVFSNVIEMRGNKLVGHSRRVADLSRKLAKKLNLDSRETQEIFVAALMLDIGKIGFSDELLATPVSQMNGEELGQFHKHTLRAEQLLMPLQDLQTAAKIIRHQHERFDGRGFPDGLTGENIPFGARILALASDYDNLQNGSLVAKRVSVEDAQAIIIRGAGNRYDEKVVLAFRQIINNLPDDVDDKEISIMHLEPGMILSADVISKDGMLLLPADYVLDQHIIGKLALFEHPASAKLVIRVYSNRRK
ncbi:HD domain-containing phosphohydrolase [Undibacterium sp. TS12]|uniref:HD domain-containing phosphohydrolase n=1 Tax=Undibacterium sp. TS12 TaxID=2908202 RepID=UPI001F4D32B8|nr:HD domain-containing phosphohydrolase [Undibacterium sp. TS12]MCH8618682.1 response regulator [Undibacterium sp. TS12]